MHGPSSSHTAGSYRIGRMARHLLGEKPRAVTFSFDPGGSYAMVYRQQGVDLAFAAGIMEWPITDDRFDDALIEAEREGIRLDFRVIELTDASHPNTVLIQMEGISGGKLEIVGRSTGGGGVALVQLEGNAVHLDGKAFEIVVQAPDSVKPKLEQAAAGQGWSKSSAGAESPLMVFRSEERPDKSIIESLNALDGVRVRVGEPVFFTKKGSFLYEDYAGMLGASESYNRSLGETCLAAEGRLLGLHRDEVVKEALERFRIMRQSVERGMDPSQVRMQLLRPTAHKVMQAEAQGRTAVGGMPTRAAARAMAVMHISNSQGTVCAAPTGGSAGTIPGVMTTLAAEFGVEGERLARSLMAAGAVGWLIARQSTFAAEVAGCQVEIGAAGAMAAAAVVDAFGGDARQAADAAAIALQNSMGSVCDLVQGMCEVPCHTRNAVAAASAFVCADLILGGYENPVPLNETIDAVDSVGRMLPVELRCTARGGLAVCPSAKSLPLLR